MREKNDIAAPTDRWRAMAARCLDAAAQGGVLPAPWRNALFALFIGGILAYGAAFAWYMLDRFDLLNLILAGNNDDAYYYFQIAYHLAEGKFSTFDGGITRTNGYHPLWLFMITPFYWVFDKETALFAIKAFEIMLVAGGVALIATAARLARLPWYLMFAALPTLYQHRVLILGMEAAAALFMLSLFILALLLFARNPTRWKRLLAAVAFALPWVRLEYVAISLAATVALCLIERSWQEHSSDESFGGRSRSIPSLKAYVPLLGAVAGILVYFAYNGIVFGGIVPVSGATKHVWSQNWWEEQGGYSLTHNFRAVLQHHAFSSELLVALAVCALLLLVWWFARRAGNRGDRLLLAFLVGVFGLAAGHLAKFAHVGLTLHPRFLGYTDWYYVPAYLLMAIGVFIGCSAAVYFVRRFILPKSAPLSNALSSGIIVASAAFLISTTDFTGSFRYIDRKAERYGIGWNFLNYTGTQVTNRVLHEGSIVGSWDSGIVGYFSRFPVVNLDGLSNSYEYLHGYRNAGRKAGWSYQGQYVDAEPHFAKFKITHFAQLAYGGQKFGNLVYDGPSNSFLRRDGQKMWFQIWSATPMEIDDPAAWIWNRLEPHFDDRSGDTGLLVDGRLVQAFFRDCTLDEVVAWSWMEREDEKAVIKSASSAYRTQTGLCVATIVLPRTALPASVRAEKMNSGTEYLAEMVGDSQPAIRSEWNVYLVENSLIYAKERCSPEDIEPRFLLHLIPVDDRDLPDHRRRYGFDNLDFAFRSHRLIEGEDCVAKRVLPDYDIAAISTGQYLLVEGGFDNIWKAELDLIGPVGDRQVAP